MSPCSQRAFACLKSLPASAEAGGSTCGGKCTSQNALRGGSQEVEDQWKCQNCGNVTPETAFFVALFQDHQQTIKQSSQSLPSNLSPPRPSPENAATCCVNATTTSITTTTTNTAAHDRILWLQLEDKWIALSYSKVYWSLAQVPDFVPDFRLDCVSDQFPSIYITPKDLRAVLMFLLRRRQQQALLLLLLLLPILSMEALMLVCLLVSAAGASTACGE